MMLVNGRLLKPVEDPEFPGREIIQPKNFVQVKGIDFSILLGTVLLCWGPQLIVHILGYRKLRKVINTFNVNDAAKGPIQALKWNLTDVSIFGRSSTMLVNLPYYKPPNGSLFDPRAYLPPYLASTAPVPDFFINSKVGGEAPDRQDFDAGVDEVSGGKGAKV